ncbi:MAG: ATP phosphoribosyltransferase regulatory subunit [Thermoleophilaceae bacterium]
MIHPIPPGTHDVMPEEMRELRALTQSLHAVFDRAGYGEVSTPALEYEDVLRRGDERAAGAGFRTFDDRGNVLALRSDATIPIARLVASRLAGAPAPIRLCYFAHAYRAVQRGSGHAREFLQGGIELIAAPAPAGDAEVAGLAIEGLAEAGLRRHRIGIGDGTLFRRLLEEVGIPRERWSPLVEALTRRDLVALEARVDQLGLTASARDLLVRLPTLRGGREILEQASRVLPGAFDDLLALHELLSERGVVERAIFDLGLVRDLGYYTGAVFEVYDPAVGFAIGGGGRYDELIGRFGDPLPACGVAFDIHRVHVARMEEERLA